MTIYITDNTTAECPWNSAAGDPTNLSLPDGTPQSPSTSPPLLFPLCPSFVVGHCHQQALPAAPLPQSSCALEVGPLPPALMGRPALSFELPVAAIFLPLPSTHPLLSLPASPLASDLDLFLPWEAQGTQPVPWSNPIRGYVLSAQRPGTGPGFPLGYSVEDWVLNPQMT